MRGRWELLTAMVRGRRVRRSVREQLHVCTSALLYPFPFLFLFSVAAEAQGGVPTWAVPAGGTDDRHDQSDRTGLGELLPDWACESVFILREGLGGAEGPASHDASAPPSRLWLEEVE